MLTQFSYSAFEIRVYSLEALKVHWFPSLYFTVCFRDVGEIVGKLYEEVDSPPPILMVGHRYKYTLRLQEQIDFIYKKDTQRKRFG